MLNLSEELAVDLQSNSYTIYPFVIIDNDIYISTVKEVLKTSTELPTPLYFKDYNLKVSQITESIDTETHSFKVSNVNLSFNNYNINGIRFSDVLSEKINKQVLVYYKTQSIDTISASVLIYKGYIKRISHSSDTISLSLENSADIEFDKDVPIANLGFSSNTYNKDYINRAIPFTYGIVDKAPVIPWVDTIADTGKTTISVIPDDIGIITGSDRGIFIRAISSSEDIPELKFEEGINKQSYLHIYKDDYFRVLQEYNSIIAHDNSTDSRFDLASQYLIDDSKQFITIPKSYTGLFPNNPPAINQFQTVKILRPNQTELLISEDGIAEAGNVGSVINITPLTGILRPEAAVDSEENPSMLLNYDNLTEFNTFTQIPNNQTTEENVLIDDGDLVASLFVNSNQSSSFSGIYHPDSTYTLGRTNYLWSMCSWMQLNAHHCNIEFINIPSGDMIITKAWERMIDNGWAVNGDGHFFRCKQDSSSKVKIFHQYALSDGFKNAWINACEGIDGLEVSPASSYSGHYEAGDYHSYWATSPPLSPYKGLEDAFVNLSYIFANPDKKPYYPQTVFKIYCDAEDSNNLQGIRNVYVGQWDETTMAGALDDDEVFLDLLLRPTVTWVNGEPIEWYNLTSTSGLFISNDLDPYLATFKPYQLKQKSVPDNDSDWNVSAFRCAYGAKYNGAPIGHYAGAPFNEGSSYISDDSFAGGYGFLEDWYNMLTGDGGHAIHMNSMCQHDASDNSSTVGGQSWWMLVKEDIPRDKLFRNLSAAGTETQGDYNDVSCNTMVRAGTLIPCNNRFDYNVTGKNFFYDFTYNITTDRVLLSSGNDEASPVPEQRLSILFPISDLKTKDYSENSTETFVYGDVKVIIPNNDLGWHNTSSEDDILVQAYATDLIEDEDVNYNAMFVGDSNFATNLIQLQGDEDIFTSGGEVSWSVQNFWDEDDDGNLFNELEKYRIADWRDPDSFSAISLAYRIRNQNQNDGSMVQLSTNIASIALLQYTVYEDVFSDNLYADIEGRRDNDSAYYSLADASLLENPASIMFHFIDKELGAIDSVDLDRVYEAIGETSGLKLGFSITDEINGKQLLTEISKSTRLYPRFNAQGDFSYAFIPRDPSSSITLKENHIIKFKIDRTKVEDVKTMVNVKYKKDYASDKYRRETGYCDGYDFFGNGEGGKEVYKNVGGGSTSEWIKRGYEYSYLNLKREDNVLEFKSDFIRDSNSAVQLRNFLYLQHCNQHTIIECTLPMKYLALEVGDVVEFDKIINKTKAFGEDYSKEATEFYYRNAQKIYTKFIITHLVKTSKNIKIKCMQLHALEGDFTTGKGSVSRRSILGLYAYTNPILSETAYINEHITYEDIDIFESILSGTNTNLTLSQKIAADISLEGAITQYDLSILQTIMANTNFSLGDIDGDGDINVADIIAIVSYIDGTNNWEEDSIEFIAADINADGVVNVADIMALVALLIGD